MNLTMRSAAVAIVAHLLLLGALSEPARSQTEEKAGDLWSRETLLGDFGGLRPFMAGYGAKLEISETSEVLGNVTGGFRRGAVYEGLTDLALSVDLSTYFGAPGTVFARAYQIHGRGLTANYLGNIAPVSGIEATRTTRLFELWYELPLAGGLDLRLGQQSASTEFTVSTTAQLFVNATFGWANLPSLDLPSGGPNYPLATPGLRLKATPSDELTLLFGLYNGDPAGPGAGDPQLRDASGTAFRINDGAFVIAEARYNPEKSDHNGTYRLGGWFHSGEFADQRFDVNGIPLASPASSGTPRQHRHNSGLYAVVDQPLLRMGDGEEGATAFVRIMGAPGNRNLSSSTSTAVLPMPARSTARTTSRRRGRLYPDQLGGTRARCRCCSIDRPAVSGALGRDRHRGHYRLQLTPWWQLQPNFQYVINPAAGILDPNRPGRRLGDAAVFGLRTTVTF